MAEAKAFKMIPHCTKDTIQYEMDELVRCKDCKHYDGNGTCMKIGIACLMDCWFCADGKRRETE